MTWYLVGLEVPLVSKYLLVAALLASFNPPHLDAQYFSLHTSKKKASKRLPVTKNDFQVL